MGARVAVVDDEGAVRTLFERYLVSMGHEVSTFACGADLLADVENGQSFDVFLLDVMMPNMDGFELCRRMREHTEHRFSPIVFLTAMNNEQVADEARRCGADDLLNKPIHRVELGLRIDALLRLKEALKAKEEQQRSMRLFISMLVHDLKNPLSAILLNLDFLQHDGLLEEDERDAVGDVMEMTKRIQRRVHAMLEIAKSEVGAQKPNLERFVLRDSLDTLLSTLRQSALAVGVHLSLECRKDAAVIADREMLARMVENLLDNALRYAPRGSTVVLRVAEDGDDARISVIDAGRGIPADQAKRIFEPFIHAGDRQRGSSNAGLGLAFCHVAALAQHGSVVALPGPAGVGTEMRITLPGGHEHKHVA